MSDEDVPLSVLVTRSTPDALPAAAQDVDVKQKKESHEKSHKKQKKEGHEKSHKHKEKKEKKEKKHKHKSEKKHKHDHAKEQDGRDDRLSGKKSSRREDPVELELGSELEFEDDEEMESEEEHSTKRLKRSDVDTRKKAVGRESVAGHKKSFELKLSEVTATSFP
jgi:hypothetical protein